MPLSRRPARARRRHQLVRGQRESTQPGRSDYVSPVFRWDAVALLPLADPLVANVDVFCKLLAARPKPDDFGERLHG